MTTPTAEALDQLSSVGKCSLELDAESLLDLVELIQDGLKNPRPGRPLYISAAGRAFVDGIRQLFEGYPAVVALIDGGME